MKQFITRAQDFGKKAAGLRQAVQNLPGHAAKIREAVTMTGGELHQLRADVQSSIHSLKADTEEHLLKTMREINDHALVFEEAGYELSGMDLDLALSQRLAVHLEKFEEVPLAALRALLSQQRCETVRSMLSGIIKAEETAANVELSHLRHVGLVVHVGALPMIRMCWRTDEDLAREAFQPVAATVAASAAAPAQTSLANSPGLGSMFEPRPMPGSGVRVVAAPAAMTAPPVAPTPAPVHGSAWSQSALDRFKKMPGESKYGR